MNDNATQMIDVGAKANTQREAVAAGFIRMQSATLEMVRTSTLPKGNAVEVARVAAILAAKNTPQLIPLCHPLLISHASCEFDFSADGVAVQTRVRCAGQTGVEMEALAACAAALLSIYDMTKGVDDTLEISNLRLLEKRGGKSGDFVRRAAEGESNKTKMVQLAGARLTPGTGFAEYSCCGGENVMSQRLSGKRVAILATDGFEQSELASPKKALEEAGATVQIVAPHDGSIKGWKDKDWGDEFPVDVQLSEAKPQEYDALMLPGGVMNPDKLRQDKDAVAFVQAFFEAGKPVAAICHGPQTLIEAGVVDGRTMTSYPSVKTDLINAGAHWVDQEVVVDHGLVTSRKPADLDAFNAKMIEEIGEGQHAQQHA
jgi:protease I